jgi:hypothetical protein
MIKLTKQQIGDAASAAYKIHDLERAKDKLAGFSVPFRIDSFRGDVIDIPVPMESVRKELDDRIAAAHKALAALGIEMLPGGEERADCDE